MGTLRKSPEKCGRKATLCTLLAFRNSRFTLEVHCAPPSANMTWTRAGLNLRFALGGTTVIVYVAGAYRFTKNHRASFELLISVLLKMWLSLPVVVNTAPSVFLLIDRKLRKAVHSHKAWASHVPDIHYCIRRGFIIEQNALQHSTTQYSTVRTLPYGSVQSSAV